MNMPPELIAVITIGWLIFLGCYYVATLGVGELKTKKHKGEMQ